MATPERIPAAAARRLFMGAQGLLDDPARRATAPVLEALVRRLGFVQMDSIQVVARAHDLTLGSRLDAYRPDHLKALLEARRSLFEAFTHDASAVPTGWFAHWKPRFRRDRDRLAAHRWWQRHFQGTDAERVMADVLARITAEGPLGSADFEHPERRGPWWDWKPQKAALDVLWRCGELLVAGRDGFEKRYDLAERVLPGAAALPEPDPAAQVAWACGTAAQRLQVFTPRELAAFWDAVSPAEARAWCEAQVRRGALVPVRVARADGSEAGACAAPDWRRRLAACPEPPDRARLLCPFDPVLRDRARAQARFGFDYRFEAFVPAARRRHGYYTLPILEGDRFTGRLDAKLHRGPGLLEVRGLWWEPGIRVTGGRRRALAAALERLARLAGGTDIQLPG